MQSQQKSTLREEIAFFDLELYFMYSVDLSLLVREEHRDLLEKKRGETSWFQEIIGNFSSCSQIGNLLYSNPQEYISEFRTIAQTIKEKNLFTDSFLKEYAPLVFSSISAQSQLAGFSMLDHTLKLAKDGVLSIRFHIVQDRGKGNKYRSYDVLSLISEIKRLKVRLNDSLLKVLTDFASSWNLTSIDIRLKQRVSRSVLENTNTYEVVLFEYQDAHRRKGRQRTIIKEMYDVQKIDLLRQLVGLARLSLPETFTCYSWGFLEDYVSKNDLGNREDELWLITEKRLLRFHPMRRDTRWDTWLKSAVSGMEMLMAKRTSMENATDFMGKELGALRSRIGDLSKSNVEYHDIVKIDEKLNRQIASLTNISQTVLDPLVLERNVTDNFYLRLMKRLSDHWNLWNLHSMVTRYFEDVYNLSNTIRGMAETKREAKRIGAIELLSLIFAVMAFNEIFSNIVIWWFTTTEAPATLHTLIMGLLLSMTPAVLIFLCVYFLYLRRRYR